MDLSFVPPEVRAEFDARLVPSAVRKEWDSRLKHALVKLLHPRDEHGNWIDVAHITPVKRKAWNGEQVNTETHLTKQQTGRLGEAIVIKHLQRNGFKDARPLNAKQSNFPVDVVMDHKAIEVKTGLVSNSKNAQQWRATIGQPGKAETKWLKTASPEEKRMWNTAKSAEIIDRKTAATSALSKAMEKEYGRKVSGATVTTIINPDTRTVDVFEFKGFHSRIAWGSDAAAKAYKATYRY